MMNALLIDSDLDSLSALEQILRQDGRMAQIHCCAEPGSAWPLLRRYRPDAVFLDSRFHGQDKPLDGTALALRIRKAFPRLQLVFISSDATLAFAACQSFPLAFTLKPVRASQIQPVLDRLFLDAGSREMPIQSSYALRCFGEFEVVSPLPPALPIRLPTRLSRALLSYLITNFDRAVPRAELMAQLMPERTDELAVNLLHVTLYKLRRFLEQNSRILAGTSIREHYRLFLPDGVCDLVDFARFVRHPLLLTAESISQAEAIARLYRGPGFAFEDYPWAEALRTELELAHEQLLLRIADYRWSHNEPGLGEQTLKNLIQINPLSEAGHCALLEQYLKRHERRKFLTGFEHYQRIMREELDAAVDSHYQRAYQQLRMS